jgi:hypothetical protein
MAIGLGLGLSLVYNLATVGGAPVAVNGDPVALTILGSSALPDGSNIDPNGWVAAVQFKGTSIGQTLTANKVAFTVSEPGYDSTGSAILVSRTITGTHFLRSPLYGSQWTSGATFTAGAGSANHVWNKAAGNNTTYIFRCTGAGAGTSTVAPTHASGSVTEADGYTWLFVSNTDQSSAPPQSPIEAPASAGADAVVYVALDKYVSPAATIPSSNIQAGAYTGSNAGNDALITKTNSSAFAGLKPHAEWTMPPWQVFGNSLHVELYADHPLGQSGRTCACVKFKIYDNSGADTGLSANVTAMTQSTNGTTTYGNPLPVYQADIDISSLTDGSLYSVRAIAYPFIGVAWDSDTDGFGSATSGWSVSTKMAANTSKRIPFTKDASFTPIYAFANTSASATPGTSTTLATARANYFGSIKAAADALQTANGGKLNYKTILYVTDGATLTAFAGDMSTKTYDTSWLTIGRDPAGVSTTTISPDTVTAANRKSGARVKFQDLALVTTTTTPVIDNITTSSIVDFQQETWFERCALTGMTSGAQQPITRMGLFWTTNCLLTSTANMQGSTTSAWKLNLCCTITGSGTDGPLMNSVHTLGVIAKPRCLPSSSLATSKWNENGQLLDTQIYAFNSWYNCSAGASSNVAAFSYLYTTGGSWVNNLIESTSTASKGGQLAADGSSQVVGRLYNFYNTSAGDGQNFVYNSVNTTQVKKIGIAKFNALPDRNIKQDWLDNTDTTTASANRTGSFSSRYGVEWRANGITTPTHAPSASAYTGEVTEVGSFMGGTPGFHTDASKLGTSAGNGDYRPTTSSSFKGMIGASEQMFPFDLLGVARKADGTGACGAFEWA